MRSSVAGPFRRPVTVQYSSKRAVLWGLYWYRYGSGTGGRCWSAPKYVVERSVYIYGVGLLSLPFLIQDTP